MATPAGTPNNAPATITLICSCGAREELRAALRGFESACAECGRIFRIPSVGDQLDLRENATTLDPDNLEHHEQMRADFERLAATGRSSRAGSLLVLLVIALVLAFVAYLIWA